MNIICSPGTHANATVNSEASHSHDKIRSMQEAERRIPRMSY
jgi:hypothetical protein